MTLIQFCICIIAASSTVVAVCSALVCYLLMADIEKNKNDQPRR